MNAFSANHFRHANASTITTWLVVGGDLDTDRTATAVRQLDELVRAGVTHVIDVRSEWDDAAFVARLAPAVRYLHHGVEDAGQEISPEWFDTVVTFARGALLISRSRLFVHCHMGINRGPSAAFAIMLDQGWSPVAALAALRAGRGIAVTAYAEDALEWHHTRTGADPATRAAERAAVAHWRAENPLDVTGAMRLVLRSEIADEVDPSLSARSALEEMCERPAWLIQYSRAEIASLRAEWHRGEDYAAPTFERHADDVESGDVVLFWQMGPKGTAGIAALGVVADEDPEWLDHAASYQFPEGPRSARRSQIVEIVEVFDNLRVTRPELRARPEFSGKSFELFACPNRPNAFRVDAAQLRYILGAIYPFRKAA